ncbi:MAG: hypothetical protein LBU58_09990 [Clostridiales bacterium]|jgi:ABC-type glycerol-3-phosphate transport system substrate-binding protein|nr:hypothetical protein [Clostridiales bacterium]
MMQSERRRWGGAQKECVRQNERQKEKAGAWRKWAAAALVIALCASVAACGGGTQQAATTAATTTAGDGTVQTTAAEAAAAETGAEQTGGAAQDLLSTDERLTISVANRNLEAFDKETDESYKYVSDKFNVDFEIYPVPNSGWMDTIRQYAAANDLPDVFVGEGWDRASEISKYIEDGLVRDIPDEFIALFPEIKKNIDLIDRPGERYTDGKWYFLPRMDPHGRLSAYYVEYYYRIDYANNLREKGKLPVEPADVKNLDDLTALITAMAKDDPDDNGKADTFGLTLHREFEFNVIYPMFGYRDWNYNENQWVFGYKSEEAKNATKWIYDLMRAGVLDPEYVANTQDQRLEKFSTGKAGIMLNNGNQNDAVGYRRNTWEKINPDLPIEDYVSAIPCPEINGQKAMRPKPYWMCTYFNADASDETVLRMMSIMDWMVTEEGYLFSSYGEEGVDYTLSEDGVVTSLRAPNAEGLTFYNEQTYFLTRLRTLPAWSRDITNVVKNPYMTDWALKMNDVMNTYISHTYDRQWTFYLATPVKLATTIDDYCKNSLIEIITAPSGEFEELWDKYVKSLYDEYNLQALEDEVNAEAEKMGDAAKFVPAP